MRSGLLYGISAYTIWGAFPFYFTLISLINPFEAVVWRVSSTFVFAICLVTVTKRWSKIKRVVTDRKTLGWFVLSSLLLFANWQIFVIGVMAGHILETSLGYFINPLITILIGVVVRKEKLTRLQWIAVMIATVGVIAVAVGYGKFPFIALSLALSFGFYGAVHKQVGSSVDGITGLTVETFVSTPIAVVQGIIVWNLIGLETLSHGVPFTLLVLFSGVLTAVPLILFGEATNRLPLSYVGFLQFLTPILGFLYGYFVAGEEMSPTRWFGFIAVWVALLFLILDMVQQIRNTPAGQKPTLNTGQVPLD